jgi:N-acyl-D-amino-acid deacylase
MKPLDAIPFLKRLQNGAALAVMCCVALPPGCDGNAEQRALNESLNSRVGPAMRDIMKRNDIPGGSIAVSHDGMLVFRSGYGRADANSGAAVTVDTLFRIGAVSTALTGAAILKQFEAELPEALDYRVFGGAGLLPDAAFPDWLPRRDRRVTDIRLRDLLLNTSGWQIDDDDPYADLAGIARAMGTSAPANARTVAGYMLRQRRLDADPASKAQPGSFGYNLLGRIVEYRSGTPYAQAIQRLVLQPTGAIGMRIAGADAAGRLANEATYYDRPNTGQVPAQDGSQRRGTPAYTGYVFSTADAQAGWAATPTDLVRFATGLGGNENVAPLLQKKTLALMASRDQRLADSPYSPGWDVRSEAGVTILQRSGPLPTGSYAFLQTRDDGWTRAVAFNRMPDQADIATAIAELEAAVVGASAQQ